MYRENPRLYRPAPSRQRVLNDLRQQLEALRNDRRHKSLETTWECAQNAAESLDLLYQDLLAEFQTNLQNAHQLPAEIRQDPLDLVKLGYWVVLVALVPLIAIRAAVRNIDGIAHSLLRTWNTCDITPTFVEISSRLRPSFMGCRHEVHTHEVHVHEVYAHEVHDYEVHAREMHAREMHARETNSSTDSLSYKPLW
jgi:hypothetical protein